MQSNDNYTNPLDSELARSVNTLGDEAREFYEERAGILEFCGGYSRRNAEKMAWEETLRFLAQRNSTL